MNGNATPTVLAMANFRPDGNVTPRSWYKHIRFENGKPDFLAISILADVVYWYRPTVVVEELSGRVIEVNRKFKEDLLQRSSKALALMFNVTARQASDALRRLESLGVIRREFRDVPVGKDGYVGLVTGIQFLDICPDRVFELSEPVTEVSLDALEQGGVSYPITRGIVSEYEGSSISLPHTYTTTKTIREKDFPNSSERIQEGELGSQTPQAPAALAQTQEPLIPLVISEPVETEQNPGKKKGAKKSQGPYVHPTTGVSTTDIFNAYSAALGSLEKNPLLDMGLEMTGAKRLAAGGFTADNVVYTLQYLKQKKPFWFDQHVSLQTIAKQIGAVLGGTRGENGQEARSVAQAREADFWDNMADLCGGDVAKNREMHLNIMEARGVDVTPYR